MPDCFSKCSINGTGDHDADCYCELCGMLADQYAGRCSECALLEEPVPSNGCQSEGFMGLIPQLRDARTAGLSGLVGPWVYTPAEPESVEESEHRRLCASMQIWTVCRVSHSQVKNRVRWVKLAVELSVEEGVNAVRRFAPRARMDDDWYEPDSYRFTAIGNSYIVEFSSPHVRYRRGQ
jgi:hypothetical protein